MAHSLASAIAAGSGKHDSGDETMGQRKCERKSPGASIPESSKPFTFAFDPADVVDPVGQVKSLFEAQFSDHNTGVPLTFVNEQNGKYLYSKFQFVSSYIHRGSRKAPPAPSGCECSR